MSSWHGMPCLYGSVPMLTPGQAGTRPYPSEKCSSQTTPTNTNQIVARYVALLLSCGRGSQIAEGPETERFQDTVLVFFH